MLVAQEKVKAVRAEIRAMEKIGVLNSVIEQKRNEARMISETILDAETRIGGLTRVIPKDTSFKGNQWSCQPGMKSPELSSAQKPKLEVIKSMGFNRQQAYEFEQMNKNPDIVEQVKAEARANDDLPTRSRVLQLVKEKNKPVEQPNIGRKQINKIVSALVDGSSVPTTSEVLKAWMDSLMDDEEISFNLMMVDDAIENFHMIKAFITKNRRR